MMAFRNFVSLSVTLLAIAVSRSVAEQQAYNDDQAAADDDANNAYSNYYDSSQYNGAFSAGDDTITYWTDYAILPKRCIV